MTDDRFKLGIHHIVRKQAQRDGFDFEAAAALADIAVTEYLTTGTYTSPTLTIRSH